MTRLGVISIAGVLILALLVGCNGPIWLPVQDPAYHWRAYPQPHFRAIPSGAPLQGSFGPPCYYAAPEPERRIPMGG